MKDLVCPTELFLAPARSLLWAHETAFEIPRLGHFQ